MPAPVTSPLGVNLDDNNSTVKTRKQIKRTRIARRRGRGPGDIESDEEIERELATDSESEDGVSSLEPDSDSDVEFASEDVVPDPSRPFTPNTSQSPGDRGLKETSTVSDRPLFVSSADWSEMVTEEKANGPADLPVIDFTDFDGQGVLSRPSHQKRQKKATKKAQTKSTPSQPNGHPVSNETEVMQQAASTSRSPTLPYMKRAPGQSARQAYQQRLESDPSYVPTVGGFWGHDDRLLDKDLRSLSGWWRGKWQGYGRGNGFGRGRGRAGTSRVSVDGGERQQVEEGSGHDDVPAIERAWTHDGFEEMKQREESRRVAQHTPTQAKSPQATSSFRGVRGITATRRGRGGLGHGGFASPVERSPASSGRIWFSKKPELMWTKQHEGFLYFELDPSLKPRPGQGQGIQVKLPGKQPKVVRAPPRFHRTIRAPLPTSNASNATVLEQCVVNLPKLSRMAKHAEVIVPMGKAISTNPSKETPAIIETAPRDPFVETTTMDILSPILGSQKSPVSRHLDTLVGSSSKSHQEAAARLQLEQLSMEPEQSDPIRLAKTEEAVLKNPPAVEVVTEEQPALTAQPEGEDPLAAMPTIPTVYSPPLSQPSPIYGSPYGYPPALPPGIAINQHGMTYEVATGRPVYLQAPPPPIYNPLPILPSHPPSTSFTPGHMPHHSHSHSHSHSAVSPDFLAHSPVSHTPPMNGFIDPSTGTPIFSFPRQTSRIEIRAPDGSLAVKSPLSKAPAAAASSASRSSSNLRNTAARFEPSRVSSSDTSVNGYFPVITGSSSPPENGGVLPSYAPPVPPPGATQQQQQQEVTEVVGSAMDQQQQQADQTTMMAGYPHYVQHYYYPDAYGYVHNPYVDMSQVRPYEMYPPHEGTVYY